MHKPARSLSKFVQVTMMAGIMAAIFLAPARASGGEATIAVASNFVEVLQELKRQFERTTGHLLFIATGSTGKHYAQIINGAPYDVLLAADQQRVALLIESNKAIAASRFTYAIGKLTLWSASPELIGEDGSTALRGGNFRNLAIANPQLAPYGRAAEMVLRSLGLWDKVQGKLVMGQNIGQTFSLIATGNAELGFVASSYVETAKKTNTGSGWPVPIDLYDPIRQDAVMLVRGVNKPAVKDFMKYLASDSAKAIIKSFGYGIDR